MTNRKPVTKLTLLGAVVALLLCFAMLLGTTYAWFTDSVTSSGNIIKTGKLKVAMQWANGTENPNSADTTWTNAAAGAIFEYDKWEPGYVQVRHIRIANIGNLALHYELRIVVNGDLETVDNDGHTLADAIDVYYADPAVKVNGRDELTDANKIGNLAGILNGMMTGTNNTAAGDLLPGEDTADNNSIDTVTIALKMRESAGNEYQEKELGGSFSVQLLATQLSYENDSFGPDYDGGSNGEPDNYPWPRVVYAVGDNGEEYCTLNDIHTALVNGDNITLTSNLDMTGYEWVPIEGFAGTFDGNNKTISRLTIAGNPASGVTAMFNTVNDGAEIKNLKLENVNVSGYYCAAVVGNAANADNITITNIEVVSGTIQATGYAAAIAFDVEGENVVFTNCVNRADVTSDFSASGIGAWIYPEGNSTVNNLVNYGNVTGGNRAGGIFANWGGAQLEDCENHGDVTSTGSMPAAGIVGVLGAASTIKNCINTGDVRTTANNINASAAGILGQSASAAATISYCINTGNITAENSYAGGIATSLYGTTTSKYCYNSGAVTGNNTNGNNPKHAAGGVAPKGAYGNGDKSQHCLNAGAVTANTNGATCFLTYQNITASYYYSNGTLMTGAGAEAADLEAALAELNSGAEEAFFGIENGVIKPLALINNN